MSQPRSHFFIEQIEAGGVTALRFTEVQEAVFENDRIAVVHHGSFIANRSAIVLDQFPGLHPPLAKQTFGAPMPLKRPVGRQDQGIFLER